MNGAKIIFNGFFVIFMIILFITAAGCTGKSGFSTENGSSLTTITDGYGRTVTIPVHPDRVICSGAGCLRYIVYLGAQDRIVGVDSMETEPQTGEARSYALANPRFSSLPLIGTLGGKDDPEKMIGIGPQVIFKLGSPSDQPGQVISAADTLQNKTGIPVIAMSAGSMYNPEEKAQMYATFRLMGRILGNETRAEELITYIDTTSADLEQRTKDIPVSQQKTAYVGGVAYSGAHGIVSTEPAYPPFIWIHAKNIAAGSGPLHADISKETLVNADPEFLFIDVATTKINGGGAIGELKANPAFANLSAVRSGGVYGVLPYNFYGTNYDTVLADAYFIGKVMYPDRFADIDPSVKAAEIYAKFVGKPVFITIIANNPLGFQKIPV